METQALFTTTVKEKPDDVMTCLNLFRNANMLWPFVFFLLPPTFLSHLPGPTPPDPHGFDAFESNDDSRRQAAHHLSDATLWFWFVQFSFFSLPLTYEDRVTSI